MTFIYYDVYLAGSLVEHSDLQFSTPPKNPKDIPVASFKIPNRVTSSGSVYSGLSSGSSVLIYDDQGTLVFDGVVDSRKFLLGERDSTVKITAVNRQYKKLSNFICDSYDFLESNDDYGVTINPWEYKILRSTDPSHPVENLTLIGPPVFGFNQADVAKAIIGEKLLFSHDFTSNEYLLPVTTATETSYLNTARNPAIDGGAQTTPRLQLMPNGNGVYRTSGSVESVPFMNGDPHIDAMGNITSATIRVYGVVPSGCSFTVDVCRNGGTTFGDDNEDFIGGDYASRDYSTGVISATSGNGVEQILVYDDVYGNSHDTGLNEVSYTYWEGTTSFSGKAAGNSLAYKINMTGNGSTTAYLEYVVIDAVTVSDTGINAGTVDVYDGDPALSTSTFFEGDFVSKNRLEALGDLRLSTLKDDVLEHFWNVWIDIDGDLHFKETRGSVIGTTFSFANMNLDDLDYQFDDNDIWHKCVAYGAGSGKYRTRIVSSAEFTNGGLSSASTKATYGDLAKVGKYEDGNASTASQLLRKARAVFKLHQTPFETLSVKKGIVITDSIPFDIGDTITVNVPQLGINKSFPVEDLVISESGDGGVTVAPVLGEPLGSLANAIASIGGSTQNIHVVRQASGSQTGATGSGTYFTNQINGVYTFGLSDTYNIDKVFLKAITVPYDITSTGAGAAVALDASGANDTSETVATSSKFYEPGYFIDADTLPESWFLDVPAAVNGDFAGAVVSFTIANHSGASRNYTYTITNDTQATTLETGSTGGIANLETEVFNFNYVYPDVEEGDRVRITLGGPLIGTSMDSRDNWTNCQMTIQSSSSHFHEGGTHEHPPRFGIWAFNGDDGDGDISPGTGTPPVFASNINIYVDPDDDITPNVGSQLPITFGDPSQSSEMDEIDITAFLSRQDNGKIVDGMHKIIVNSSTVSGNNTSGLGKVQFVVYDKRRTSE